MKANRIALPLVLLFASLASAEQVTHVTQYGITWTFAEEAEVGQYITGDWWVVGPVTITKIDPEPANDRHGSVVNPKAGSKHGYDKRMAGYDASMRAELPLNLKPGQSLVSTASVDSVGDKTPDTVPRHYARGPLRTAAVLTCVAEAPAENAYRPAYVGTWKKQFTTDDLQLDKLPKLDPVDPMPNAASLTRYLERPWLDHQRQWVNRMMHPLENMPDYGREITNITGDTGLALLVEQFRDAHPQLLHSYVQLGIDYYGVVQSDNHLWIGNGGHNSGRKLPIIFAGIALGDEDMQHPDATFSEDDQTYYGEGADGQKALFSIAPGNANRNHEEVPADERDTFGQGSNNWKKAEGYRKLNGPTWVSHGLAVRLLDAQEQWDHPAFLDYVDRWMREEDKASAFVKAMWNKYRNAEQE